jgi:hypothetical protein
VELGRSGIGGTHGITDVPELFFGIGALDGATHPDGLRGALPDESRLRSVPPIDTRGRVLGPPKYLSPSGDQITVRRDIREALRRQLGEKGGFARSEHRIRFRWALLQHAAVLAPAGFGELTFRHGEALQAGRLLICPDLDHVETMFPFRNHANVMFCRHDLSDLADICRAIAADPGPAKKIADEGNRTWDRWVADSHELLRRGISDHVREATRVSPPTPPTRTH